MSNKTIHKLFPSLLKSRIWGIAFSPFSLLYGIAVSLKNLFYDKKIIKPARISGKIISVGNISIGGTGKTPLVTALATMVKEAGYRTAVISRGYGGKTRGTICVSDGKNILSSPEESGDEPLLHARNLPEIPVIVDPDRIRAARYAEKHFHSEVIVLDDAFQHRKINRDIDIITINAADPWGNSMLLPGGPLREPLKNLKRGDLFIITHADNNINIEKIKSVIKKYSRNRVFLTCHRPQSFFTLPHKHIPLSRLKDQPVLAFSGIAYPDLFRKTLFDLKCDIKQFLSFPDHHYYTAADKKTIWRNALQNKVKAVITTEKDVMRIDTWNKKNIPLYYLKIKLNFMSELETFKQSIENKLNQS